MKQLNFRHLYYFWLTAREGSMARASELLDLAPQTLSGQIGELESQCGGLLFRRRGRGLELSELGRTVMRYADDMFTIAESLDRVLQLAPHDRPVSLAVGLSTSIHKLIAYQLLEPAFGIGREIELDCRSGQPDNLVRQLKKQQLDLVLTDRIPPEDAENRLHLHRLQSSPIAIFAAPPLAEQLRMDFPASLHGQPFLANATDTPYFNRLRQWFEEQKIRIEIRARIDDSALIKVFANHGHGIFAAPLSIRDEVCRQYRVEMVGDIAAVMDDLYAIKRGKDLIHPAVAAICQSSK
ncbi:MAG: LysR family transcriptional regulator [Oceanospirillaceae bacterium]|nr:LysR family transcriptional regulator [Oceanospirillaceae bacterium]